MCIYTIKVKNADTGCCVFRDVSNFRMCVLRRTDTPETLDTALSCELVVLEIQIHHPTLLLPPVKGLELLTMIFKVNRPGRC